MTELREQASARPSAGRSADVIADLEDARSAGGWMVIAGVFLAFVWWIGAGITAYGLIGLPALSTVPAPLIIGGAVSLAVPGLLIIMAGYMARANRRASGANAIVLKAATRLLSPAEAVGSDGMVLADQVKQSAHEMDQVMLRAIASMKAMSGDIGDERMRLESVSYASADNARDLTERLAAERQSLETLAQELRSQITAMNQSLPQQAQMLAQAARQAVDEVTRAEGALEGRLEGMRGAGDHLARQLTELDALARDATTRTETLTLAVTRIEEKLEQSRKTVDDAVRTGQAATDAATATSAALKDAVSSALDNARLANSEINVSTRTAAEQAAHALANLRAAGDAAAASVRAAGMAARSELDDVEAGTRQIHAELPRPAPAQAVPAPQPVPAPAAPQTPEPLPYALNGQPNGAPAPEPIIAPTITPAPAAAPAQIAPIAAAKSVDTELFEPAADAPLELGREPDPAGGAPLVLDSRLNDAPETVIDVTEPTPPPIINTPPAVNAVNGQDESDMGWRDILSDIDREDSPQLSREEIADELLSRLHDSGIRLAETFRPKHKRKIAAASTRGDDARRTATRDMVGAQVERVYKRMRADRGLMNLARQFHTFEESDALNALSQTQKTSRNASARLAAYLLIDASGVS